MDHVRENGERHHGSHGSGAPHAGSSWPGATPQIQNKLRNTHATDALAACDILDIILREEVGHVAIGNHWYRWLCEKNSLDPESLYLELTQRHEAPRLRPPFNEKARRAAGFTATEIAWLQQI